MPDVGTDARVEAREMREEKRRHPRLQLGPPLTVGELRRVLVLARDVCAAPGLYQSRGVATNDAGEAVSAADSAAVRWSLLGALGFAFTQEGHRGKRPASFHLGLPLAAVRSAGGLAAIEERPASFAVALLAQLLTALEVGADAIHGTGPRG